MSAHRCGGCGYLKAHCSCSGRSGTREAQATLQAQFIIDPQAEEFSNLRSVCEPGHPWKCLIGTMGSMKLGRRMTVRLDHPTHTGTIGVTVGDWRWERPMTGEEVDFAARFDLGDALRKPLTVKVDLTDGTWTAKPKQRAHSGKKTAANNQGRGPNNKAIKSIRSRQLAAIRQAHAGGAS